MRPCWPCSWECDEAWPSSCSSWTECPLLVACRYRRKSTSATTARSGRCCHMSIALPVHGHSSSRCSPLTGHSRASCSPPIVCALFTCQTAVPLTRRKGGQGRTWQLLLHVLVEFVAELVRADQRAGLCVTCDAISRCPSQPYIFCDAYRCTVRKRRSVSRRLRAWKQVD